MVRLHMTLQTAILNECTIAIRADEILNIIVYFHVLSMSLLPSKSLEAHFAFEFPLAAMFYHVVLQLKHRYERHGAQFAENLLQFDVYLGYVPRPLVAHGEGCRA